MLRRAVEFSFENPALSVALAMAVGVLAVGVARHLKIPGIVLLLAAGVALGPDAADVIRPSTLGHALPELVGFAVAIILFEGGMHLNLARLTRQAKPLRRLVTVGAIVTAAGGAVAARLLMGWDWRLSILFGTLVIVTGPTVITPLLRRIKVRRNVGTILEAEGIFIDAVGATIAVVALEVALAPSRESLTHGVLDIGIRLGIGAVIGLIGGGFLALLLRWKKVVPHGLENVLSLGFAVAIFQLSNAFVEESGITAAIIAGMVVGNFESHVHEHLLEFKEQLTVFFIATLFVLLSADVRVDTVLALGQPGILTVIALMVVVRPITVAVSTIRTEVTLREKAFLSWLAPRGIVAAAVASLFADKLTGAGITGGVEIRALVFLVIATTVSVQGLTGGLVAGLLGLRLPARAGCVILGANGVGRHIGELLREAGEDVTFIDSNSDLTRAAEEAGFGVVYGNGLEERTLLRARADNRSLAIAVTGNENVNFLFARALHDLGAGTRTLVSLETETSGVTQRMVEQLDAEVLFGRARRVDLWRQHLRAHDVSVERWRYGHDDDDGDMPDPLQAPVDLILPLGGFRNGKPLMVSGKLDLDKDDVIEFAFYPGKVEEARTWLRTGGWVPAKTPAPEPEPGSAPDAQPQT